MTILYDLLMFAKMREFVRIIFVCVCAFLLAVPEGKCDVESLGSLEDSSDVEALGARSEEQGEQKKEKSSLIPGGVRRSTSQSNGNTTRDSQLLSLLAARRRQLLNGRLASHLNTIASLASRANKNTTSFAQLVIRDANNSVVKRITFDNSSNTSTPTIKVVTTDGTTEIYEELRPQEIRHLLVPKIFQENRSRAGFINNRKKQPSTGKLDTLIEKAIESGLVYIPPEGLDKEAILEPDEEFQVDESNHGLYLLNYSDTDNVTNNSHESQTTTSADNKENSTSDEITTTPLSNLIKDDQIAQENKKESKDLSPVTNNTDSLNTKLEKVQIQKDKENHTLFMSDDIYNHFRALESELPVEEMAPFMYFGQKIGGQIISDNLTNSPSLSASTKTVNYIVPPPDKRKYNSRYSVTEKYRNTSANEEEINEDMDVSVVKNVIEKNKVRNTVKGPAPARHVGLVNAYRKYISTTIPSPPTVISDSLTQNANPDGSGVDKLQEHYATNTNNTNSVETTVPRDVLPIKINSSIPRNFTRSYFNLRRRPNRVITSSTQNTLTTLPVNSTTEKTDTTLYTAVVTSVSITSSMKGQNKTDPTIKNNTLNENADLVENNTLLVNLFNTTERTTNIPNSRRENRHRIRIRTTSTESSLNPNSSPAPTIYEQKPTDNLVASKLLTNDSKNEVSSIVTNKPVETVPKNNYNNTTIASSTRPKRRRRPTTTTTTTTTSTSSPSLATADEHIIETQSSIPATTSASIMQNEESTENTFKPFIVTSKTSSESSSKPKLVPINTSVQSEQRNKTILNATQEGSGDGNSQNEVVIEAEKSYTASYVLAGLGFLPVGAIIIFILRNILNKKTKEIETEYEGYFEDSDIKKESPITPVARPPLPTPSKPDQKWEFPRNKLRLQTLLGQGNFGQVWKAEADDLTGHDGLTRLVAVKSIKETASQKEKQELLNEIYIMQKIGPHPNVVTLLACCTEQEPYLLIMEYVMCGKLLTYLRERRARPDRFGGSGALTSRDLTVFAYCVARGMDYIANKGIVHRDLAARNVLVDHNKLCKIADFGMSRCAGAAAGRHALPVRWMAPEALLYNVYTHPSDVWAFGILLWEIVTLGSTPYAAMSGREVLTAVTEGYRLERPPHCKPQLYRAMHSCWHADPSQRPTFATLKSQLAELLDNEPSEGNYVDLDSFYQESSVYSDPSAIIHDEEGLSAEYDRERRCFRELNKGPANYDNRAFTLRDEELRSKFGIGTPRMGGFGIRDVPFNERTFSDGEFNERSFTDKNFNDRNFTDKNFADRNFTDKNFTDRNFTDKNFTDRNFSDKSFTDRNFVDKNFSDTDFTDRKDGKLSTSSFHRDRERERENSLVSRNSFSGFPRIGSRDNHFQLPEGRNKRVSEFECDI